jgi:hypothetical protein
MDKTNFLKLASVVLLLSILFTPNNTKIGYYLFVPGIILGIWWFTKLS